MALLKTFRKRGWWLSAAKPQIGTIWGTASLCPSHPIDTEF